MSQENVEALESAFEAWGRDGLDAFADHRADDIEWRATEGAIDDHGPLHGKDACRAYLQDWLDTFDGFTVEPVEVIDAGDERVVAVLRYSGRAKQSGVDVPSTYFAVVYVIRNWKIAGGREYATRDEALEAAGLRE
jgi:ketosteroid isomerase-like protein